MNEEKLEQCFQKIEEIVRVIDHKLDKYEPPIAPGPRAWAIDISMILADIEELFKIEKRKAELAPMVNFTHWNNETRAKYGLPLKEESEENQ